MILKCFHNVGFGRQFTVLKTNHRTTREVMVELADFEAISGVSVYIHSGNGSNLVVSNRDELILTRSSIKEIYFLNEENMEWKND